MVAERGRFSGSNFPFSTKEEEEPDVSVVAETVRSYRLNLPFSTKEKQAREKDDVEENEDSLFPEKALRNRAKPLQWCRHSKI